MKLLGIDSSGLVCSVALVTEEKVLGEYTTDQKKTHSESLLPMLAALCEALSVSLDEVDAIAIANGPGSFTGLRIGSATAKGLATALKRPIVPVPTLDALAYNLCGSRALVCPVMDARRNETYTAVYEFDGNEMRTVLSQRAVPIKDLIDALNGIGREVVFLGDGVPVFADFFAEHVTVPYTFAPPHLSRQRAASVASLGLIRYAEGKTEIAAEHAPQYLRVSQAERVRAEKQQSEGTDVSIRPAKAQDVPVLAAIEKSIFPKPWSEKAFSDALSDPNAVFLVAADKEDRAVSYIGMYAAADEGEITNVATAEAYRRKGLSFRLLCEIKRIAAERKLSQLILETRKSNVPAITLYKKAGFTIVSERKGFYQLPPEDAYVMMLRFDNA